LAAIREQIRTAQEQGRDREMAGLLADYQRLVKAHGEEGKTHGASLTQTH
jgi:hypothetical protein